jgi:hypothetical protein
LGDGGYRSLANAADASRVARARDGDSRRCVRALEYRQRVARARHSAFGKGPDGEPHRAWPPQSPPQPTRSPASVKETTVNTSRQSHSSVEDFELLYRRCHSSSGTEDASESRDDEHIGDNEVYASAEDDADDDIDVEAGEIDDDEADDDEDEDDDFDDDDDDDDDDDEEENDEDDDEPAKRPAR